MSGPCTFSAHQICPSLEKVWILLTQSFFLRILDHWLLHIFQLIFHQQLNNETCHALLISLSYLRRGKDPRFFIKFLYIKPLLEKEEEEDGLSFLLAWNSQQRFACHQPTNVCSGSLGPQGLFLIFHKSSYKHKRPQIFFLFALTFLPTMQCKHNRQIVVEMKSKGPKHWDLSAYKERRIL